MPLAKSANPNRQTGHRKNEAKKAEPWIFLSHPFSRFAHEKAGLWASGLEVSTAVTTIKAHSAHEYPFPSFWIFSQDRTYSSYILREDSSRHFPGTGIRPAENSKRFSWIVQVESHLAWTWFTSLLGFLIQPISRSGLLAIWETPSLFFPQITSSSSSFYWFDFSKCYFPFRVSAAWNFGRIRNSSLTLPWSSLISHLETSIVLFAVPAIGNVKRPNWIGDMILECHLF